MQRLSVHLIAAAAFAAVAVPAAAQQQQPPSPPVTAPPPQQLRAPPSRTPMAETAWSRAQYETFLDSASGNNIGSQPLARIDLANRVSTLIELGRCTDARLMAIRARQMCRTDRAG